MKTQFGLKSYFKPTPKLMRKVGDALLTISTSITIYGGIAGKPWLVITSAITGTAGKLITNFFSE